VSDGRWRVFGDRLLAAARNEVAFDIVDNLMLGCTCLAVRRETLLAIRIWLIALIPRCQIKRHLFPNAKQKLSERSLNPQHAQSVVNDIVLSSKKATSPDYK
jgi:hypothetical protein